MGLTKEQLDELVSQYKTPQEMESLYSQLLQHMINRVYSRYPRFYCLDCRKCFNRRVGTPYSRNRRVEQQRTLIRYVGLPLLITQLADMLGIDFSVTARRVRELHERTLQLEPSGRLAATIRARARPFSDMPYLGQPLG